MSLPVTNLDDRKFQDLVDEAKRMIPQLCPEWTNHNLSDPGVALIELFAWMTEMMLFRLNQVPDVFYTRMLNLLGLRTVPGGRGPSRPHVLDERWPRRVDRHPRRNAGGDVGDDRRDPGVHHPRRHRDRAATLDRCAHVGGPRPDRRRVGGPVRRPDRRQVFPASNR